MLSDRTRQESCTFLIILTELFTVSYKPGSVMGQKTIGCSGMRSSESKLPLLSHFKIMRLVDEHGLSVSCPLGPNLCCFFANDAVMTRGAAIFCLKF